MSVTPIDLSQLPSPDIVETLDYETLLAARKARLVSLYPAAEQAEIAATLALESEPLVKLLQENAYREIVLRQRVNDAARAVMLAYAVGTDLDHLAALFGIRRLTISPADPPHDLAAVMESDADLRARTQLAPQSFSVAGPEGAYVSHARNADGRVLDASAVSPAPCEVLVTVLARDGDGTAAPALIDAVAAALQADDVRPLTDKVTVRGAEILRYQVRARLVFFAGPDRAVALAQANRAMKQYTDSMHRLGMEVTLDGIYAAARAAGVQKVILESPLAGLPATKQQAPYCTGIELIDGGVYSNE
ncbi:baseplate J/gp47 family protein [Burkholderia cenocepacia]|uniref:Baseplate assembly protein n=1 Tax=Burkholderia cenocepacia TaxID=95486 RepID=A0A1V0DX90_9BURK|nr:MULTISPECIES: baseplate J/gp47 family protein [Burkholderia cepacia complex]ARB05765.1 baseplate assembly protein [Burkholderia cenocepacia]ARF83495.1 phage baseplate assembly protein J [Burkholderia cenocepacia]MBR7901723.1 baseplate J/gp47 family protein [Burkholderia multivorans]MBR7936747.1 baseplate J/gp47 family protein [Burkholderia cenocepacia]MBR8119659.1 baseplate J/gp47 family protein [Burkholderia cenocepacia]